MPKRILLIDPDEPFTQGLAAAANAAGFKTSVASDSEKGLALAKQENPDLIVVCVEAQPTNGYMLCTRLKKDDRLRAIPVILTSANATPDSFEKHKKLKTRAEDYLIKPFAAQAMLQKVSQLLGLSAVGATRAMADDESLGLGDLLEGEDEPIQLGRADVAQARGASDEAMDLEELEELVDIEEEPAPAAAPSKSSLGDEELAVFDQAFDALKPSAGGLPKAKQAPAESRLAPAPRAKAAVDDLDRLKRALDDKDRQLAELQAEAQKLAKAGASKGELAKLKEQLQRAREEIAALTGEKDLLREEQEELRRQLGEAQALAKQNEQRAVKAYQKLKGDEKLRDKTRKALQIALALLDDVTLEPEAGTEKESA
jgi:CheY-like chemotaxis protein